LCCTVQHQSWLAFQYLVQAEQYLASVVKKVIKIEQELTEIIFSKIVVLYEIYSKKLVTEYFWHVSVAVLSDFDYSSFSDVFYLKVHL
jgi:hypothetical protein